MGIATMLVCRGETEAPRGSSNRKNTPHPSSQESVPPQLPCGLRRPGPFPTPPFFRPAHRGPSCLRWPLYDWCFCVCGFLLVCFLFLFSSHPSTHKHLLPVPRFLPGPAALSAATVSMVLPSRPLTRCWLFLEVTLSGPSASRAGPSRAGPASLVRPGGSGGHWQSARKEVPGKEVPRPPVRDPGEEVRRPGPRGKRSGRKHAAPRRRVRFPLGPPRAARSWDPRKMAGHRGRRRQILGEACGALPVGSCQSLKRGKRMEPGQARNS